MRKELRLRIMDFRSDMAEDDQAERLNREQKQRTEADLPLSISRKVLILHPSFLRQVHTGSL